MTPSCIKQSLELRTGDILLHPVLKYLELMTGDT
jgi:hypothetical protein